jgi:hypothetical protein
MTSFRDDEIPYANDRQEAKRICDAMLSDDPQLDRLLVARKHRTQPTVDLFLSKFDSVRGTDRPTLLQHRSLNALQSGAWRLCGYSKKGCVISNYKLEYWNPDAYGDASKLNDAVDQYTRYVCYMIELMIASMKSAQDKFVVIFDLKGFYMSMVTKTNIRLMIKRLIYVAQAQYPERLEEVFLVNAPYGFETAWCLIRPLLDQKTASKISFVTKEKFLDYVDIGVLSKSYGGYHEEYRVPSEKIADEVLTG